jgi:nicotinate phosphoribosyltransferase
MFDSEYEAFKAYCEVYPNNVSLLVDTYNVLKSGVPNAIKVIKEVIWPKGIKKCAIRLDSGDMTYLSKKARIMLDEAGLTDCKIVASNSLDEYIITELLNEGAKIDIFGVGERLITAKSDPVFGGVYKLTAVEKDGKIIPKIKISENSAKIINPGHKKIVRFYDNVSGKALADLLCLAHEEIDTSNDYTIFDPVETWKTKTIYDYHIKELQVPIYKDGKLVYDRPGIEEIRAYCKQEVDSFWDEVKRLVNPHKYYVDLSQELWDLKDSLLKEYSKK